MNETKTFEAGPTRFAALGYKNFRYLWSGLVVSNMGTWMQNVTNGWLGGVKGAPHVVLIGAIFLAVIFVFVISMFWKRDLAQHQKGCDKERFDKATRRVALS